MQNVTQGRILASFSQALFLKQKDRNQEVNNENNTIEERPNQTISTIIQH